MYRISVVVVYISVAFAIAAAAIVVALPYDTSWLMVAILPLVFLAIMFVGLFMPKDRRHANSNPYQGVAGVFRADEFEPTLHHLPRSRNASSHDAPSADGFWSGTLRLGTADWCTSARSLPVRFTLSNNPVRATMVDVEQASAGDRVTDISVVEYDDITGSLYLRVTVLRHGHIRPEVYEATAIVSGDAIVPDDDTSPVALEARRYGRSDACTEAGRCYEMTAAHDHEPAATAPLATNPYLM